jgi:putative tryptophan/tyrosine transport system substrate-binding protein
MAIHVGRREFIVTLGGVAAVRSLVFLLSVAFVLSQAFPSFASAQQMDKVPNIGVLLISPLTSPPPYYQAFLQGLSDLGYFESKNIAIVAKSAGGNPDRLPDLARELVRLNVNLMVVFSDQGLRAAKEATDATPIIVLACDPLDSLVASIARPGGKATGLTCISSELAGKRLQLLKELLPSLARVAILYNTGDRNKEWEYKQSQDAADKLKLILRAYEARSSIEIDEAFTRMIEDHMQALIILNDVLTVPHQKKLADLALANRLPAMFGFREFTEMGGLISYGASGTAMSRRAASYVDKILKGSSPGDLPIEQPTRFELVVNLKTAKALGLEIPPNFLARADEVIE